MTGTPEVELFFDGACPLCSREIGLLRRLDRRGRVRFIDIADPAFDPTAVGKTEAELHSQIHARRAGGEWVVGVEAFRVIYGLLGFGWLVPLTRAPFVSGALDAGYRAFAKHRLRLRPPLGLRHASRRAEPCVPCSTFEGRDLSDRMSRLAGGDNPDAVSAP